MRSPLGQWRWLLKINPFLSGTVFDNPMDMEFDPDGSLYTLEYGDGFFSENPEAQLARIDYVKGIRSPIAEASGTPTNGAVPLTVVHLHGRRQVPGQAHGDGLHGQVGCGHGDHHRGQHGTEGDG